MKKNAVLNNASWIVGGKIVQSLMSLVVGMLTARYLGPANYGLISYAAAVTAFFVPVMQLGLRSTLVQELITKPDQEGQTMGTALVMDLVSAVACIVGIMSFVSIANRGETDTIIVCVLYGTNLIFQALEMIQYWFQAKLLSKYTSVTSMAAYAVVSVYRIWLLVSGKNVYWFAISQAIDFLIISICLLMIYHYRGAPKLSFSFSRAGEMFRISKYYIVSSMMVTIFGHVDSIMLKLMVGDSAAGIYSATMTCATMTSFVFAAIIDSARPSILEAKKLDQGQFEYNMKRLASVVIWLSLVQCAGFTLFAELVVAILYGADYAGAVPALRVIIWYSTFSYLGSVRNIWILAEGKQKYLWIINLSGALGNVLLNWLLIPGMGVLGAALASLITQFFTNVVIGFLMKPLCEYNRLLLQGLNPRYMLQLLRRK